MRRVLHLLSVFVLSARSAKSHALPALVRTALDSERDTLLHTAYAEQKIASSKAKDQYRVDGRTIPDVRFDVGESYAGLMPISDSLAETRKLFFCSFPSDKAGGANDLTIWQNGGPGCSSLFGLVQENGPWLWPRGAPHPIPNAYSWHKLTNMLYIEQPVGVGFTQGERDAKDELDVSREFLGFLLQFAKIFPETAGMGLYFTGESYAGQYLPYAAEAVYNYTAKEGTTVLNPRGLLVVDGVLENNYFFQTQLTTWPFVEANARYFDLDADTLADLQKNSSLCGYDAYLEKNLVFPGVPVDNFTEEVCDLWGTAFTKAQKKNPCFDYYDVTAKCPYATDIIAPRDPTKLNYFSRRDVQDAIHAPHEIWNQCVPATNVFVGGDNSVGVDNGVLQGLIAKNEKTIWTAGDRDFVVMTNGTLLLIQSMLFNGAHGFSIRPNTPYRLHRNSEAIGVWREERGLTYVEFRNSGHMVPMYEPRGAFKLVQYLLGHIETL